MHLINTYIIIITFIISLHEQLLAICVHLFPKHVLYSCVYMSVCMSVCLSVLASC